MGMKSVMYLDPTTNTFCVRNIDELIVVPSKLDDNRSFLKMRTTGSNVWIFFEVDSVEADRIEYAYKRKHNNFTINLIKHRACMHVDEF